MGRNVQLFSLPRIGGGEETVQFMRLSSAMELRQEIGSHIGVSDAVRGMLVGFGVPGVSASRVADAVRVAGHYLAGHGEQSRHWLILDTDDVGVTVVLTDSERLPKGDDPDCDRLAQSRGLMARVFRCTRLRRSPVDRVLHPVVRSAV
ncbi:hypothetical protein AB0N07_08670 [Streptomyces sp. NPDC051172]|uniref:hypothetical protein n=1 Tax=Streptomyces sp. NPDC051172 TaxID=3155796 RepID=UPI00342D189B